MFGILDDDEKKEPEKKVYNIHLVDGTTEQIEAAGYFVSDGGSGSVLQFCKDEYCQKCIKAYVLYHVISFESADGVMETC